MRDTTIARSYASALYALGERHESLAEFGDAFEELARVLEDEPRLRTFLETPKLDPATKKRVLRAALGARVPPLFLNFLLVVLDKRRQGLLRAIARDYHTLLDERLGRLHARITLAREPDERSEREIAERLSDVLGKTVIPHVRVDPQILGGIVVRYGDTVLDGSLRRQLLGMKRQLMEAKI